MFRGSRILYMLRLDNLLLDILLHIANVIISQFNFIGQFNSLQSPLCPLKGSEQT